MSPRWNWDSPTPLAASECALPPGPKGGGAHSPAAKGVGESQFQRGDIHCDALYIISTLWPILTSSNNQSWALAHFFEVRYPLPTQFFPLDR